MSDQLHLNALQNLTISVNKIVQALGLLVMPVVGPVTDNAVARFDGVTGTLLQNSGVTIDDSNNLRLPSTSWLAGRNATDSADLNMFRVNSSNFTEWSNPIYYSDSTFVDHHAKATIVANTAAPTGLYPAIYSLHEGKGDNTTFIGVTAGYFQARDRSDVTALNKGVLYGITVDVVPQVARGSSSPADDVVCVAISNGGTAKATEAIYVGTNAGIVGPEFATVFQADCDADDLLNASGSFIHGINFVTGGPATFSGNAIYLGNNTNVSARNNANDADVVLVKLTTADALELRGGVVSLSATAATIAGATLIPAATSTSRAGLRLVTGSAPTSPVDGDMWREDNTNTGLKIRVNGVTKTITLS